MKGLSKELREKLGEIDFDTIQFKDESEDEIVVIFSKESEKIKLENIALGAYSASEDTEETRRVCFGKLLQAVVDNAIECAVAGESDV